MGYCSHKSSWNIMGIEYQRKPLHQTWQAGKSVEI